MNAKSPPVNAKSPTAPKAIPVATPTSRPFWEGTQAGELRLQRCTDCAQHYLYPRTHCPLCGSANTAWVKVSGRGRLYSYVISHMAAPGWEGEVPYVIAVVELDEGPRMLSNLVGVPPDPAALVLDSALEVAFQARGNMMLPLFKPSNSSAAPLAAGASR